MSRVTARDSTKQRDDNLRGIDQSRPRAPADWDSTPVIGIACGAVSERKKLPQVIEGVSEITKAILGAAPMGERILGGE